MSDRVARRVARRVSVRGQVQGVFFRDTCRREAVARDVTGWVRNEYDGTVSAVFEGTREAVDEMVTWARTGPPHASVDMVDVLDVEPSEAAGFDVR